MPKVRPLHPVADPLKGGQRLLEHPPVGGFVGLKDHGAGVMAPNTTYSVRFTTDASTGDTAVRTRYTIADAEDSGATNGWSIDNDTYRRQQGTWESFERATKMAIKGEAIPHHPRNLTELIEGPDKVTLRWEAPRRGPTPDGYRIFCRNSRTDALGTFTAIVNDTGSAATTYEDTTVAANGRYVYRVATLNGTAVGPRTSYFVARVPDRDLAAEEVHKPLNLEATASGGNVVLKWAVRSTTGITGYQIRRQESSGDNTGAYSKLVHNTNSTDRTYTDSTVESGKSYVYKVRAWMGSERSAASRYMEVAVP